MVREERTLNVYNTPGDEERFLGVKVASPLLPNGRQESTMSAPRLPRSSVTCGMVTWDSGVSSGLHAHVGLQQGGFELLPLQKLASVWWLGGETTLNYLQPDYYTFPERRRLTSKAALSWPRCWCSIGGLKGTGTKRRGG